MGPPVYFVVNNTAGHMDFSLESEQNLVCDGLDGCEEDSLGAQVFNWQKVSEESKIATAPMNWVNQYLKWIHADGSGGVGKDSPDDKDLQCCKIYNGDKACMNETDVQSRPDVDTFRCVRFCILRSIMFFAGGPLAGSCSRIPASFVLMRGMRRIGTEST